MVILHAGFLDHKLCVWGETAEGTAPPESLPQGEIRDLTAWLPTANSKIQPSSTLLGEPIAGKTALAPWPVRAVSLGPAAAIDLLCACRGQTVLQPGVIIGDDLAWWVHAMRFAGALVANEHFLPDLDASGRAGWRPLLLGQDIERLRKLAAAMPDSARALGADGVEPNRSALAVLADFAAALTDHFARTSGTAVKPAAKASPHDQWLYALHSADGLVPDAADLARHVREWQRPLALASESPYRLTFRLEEPAADQDTWQVRYFLQSAQDPSLLIPAAQVWRRKKSEREQLLFWLGQASSVSPRIEASLHSPDPAGYDLEVTGAWQFLSADSQALEQAGFGVLLPAWWTRKGTKTRLAARAKVKAPSFTGGAGLSLDQVVHFEWQLALGGEPLTFAELKALADLKAPLVKVRGQWVQMTAGEIQAALDFWRNRSGSEAPLREVVRMALGATQPRGDIEFEGVDAEGWVAELLRDLEGHAAFEELPPPAGLEATLRPYQLRGYSWLAFLRRWGLGACLADDMGLGKTIQTLSLIARDWDSDGHRPVLLVCPTSVVGNWQKEAARFTPALPVMVHHGAARTRGGAFREQALSHAIVISSYALLHRDFEILKQVPWGGVVLDEAQNIKNPETKQAGAARAIPADFRIALTGTPVENSVGDLWSIMEFLNPGFLGSRAQFKEHFYLPIQANRDSEALGRLRRLTGPFLLRRVKTDKSVIADLPDKLEMKVFCNLTREQASLYAAVVKEAHDALESAEGIQRKGLVLATLSKLKQVCNHPAQFLGDNSAIPGRSGKLARLTEMLEEILAVGDRALIFTQFAEMGTLIRRHLQETYGREVLFLHGAVSKKQRDRMVERFQAGEAPVFVLSLKAGGTGLNLTAANHVFHFDRWWNPAVENQATDRAFRIGQTRNVQVHKFLCVGTLEERIDEMIERKQAIAAGAIGAGEGWLTELSNSELKQLFALRKEAIAE